MADTLSPAYNMTEPNAMYDQRETVHVNLVKRSCPLSDEMWKKMAQATINDEVLQKNYKGHKMWLVRTLIPSTIQQLHR